MTPSITFLLYLPYLTVPLSRTTKVRVCLGETFQLAGRHCKSCGSPYVYFSHFFSVPDFPVPMAPVQTLQNSNLYRTIATRSDSQCTHPPALMAAIMPLRLLDRDASSAHGSQQGSNVFAASFESRAPALLGVQSHLAAGHLVNPAKVPTLVVRPSDHH